MESLKAVCCLLVFRGETLSAKVESGRDMQCAWEAEELEAVKRLLAKRHQTD